MGVSHGGPDRSVAHRYADELAMTVLPIRWCGTVSSRGEVPASIPCTGDVVLVSRSNTLRWLVFRCPCGCGDELPINLDYRLGPAWKLYNTGPQASLYPSIWRESGCKSHFILSRGRIWLLGRRDDSWDLAMPDEKIVASVRQYLRREVMHYAEIADSLSLEPWDTLRACKALVRRGLAVEGTNKDRGRFRLS